MDPLTAHEVQEDEDSTPCILTRQDILVVADNPAVAQLICRGLLESPLQERIGSYRRSLAEIRREEMALKEQLHDLLRRFEVGGTNG
jgi:hypothetical protein